MKNLLILILALSFSNLASAAPKNLLECRWWQSKDSFVRLNVKQLTYGRLRASFNDEAQGNMNATTTFVTRAPGGAGAVIFQSQKPSSSIRDLRVEIYPGQRAVTVSPWDGSRLEGMAGQLSVVHVDLRTRSGLARIDTKVVCRY